jgi:ribosomal protein S3
MENHFGFKRFYKLNIHGINVDTQKEDNIIVTVYLRCPGLLIGKAGNDIDSIEEKLSQSFGKNVTIEISEVKIDINLPRYDY